MKVAPSGDWTRAVLWDFGLTQGSKFTIQVAEKGAGILSWFLLHQNPGAHEKKIFSEYLLVPRKI